VLPLQVGQQGTTLVDQLQQATTGVVVLLVHLEVLGQLLDAGREQRHLDFRRTGVVGHALELVDDLGGIDGHQVFLGDAKPAGTQPPVRGDAPHGPPIGGCFGKSRKSLPAIACPDKELWPANLNRRPAPVPRRAPVQPWAAQRNSRRGCSRPCPSTSPSPRETPPGPVICTRPGPWPGTGTAWPRPIRAAWSASRATAGQCARPAATGSSSGSRAAGPPWPARASSSARRCIRGLSKGSTQVRRRAAMWPPQPRASPRSRARLRI